MQSVFICLQAELTDKEFEKLLAEEMKQKKHRKPRKKPKHVHRAPRSRILNRKRSKVPLNESKSDESGDEVTVNAVISHLLSTFTICVLHSFLYY